MFLYYTFFLKPIIRLIGDDIVSDIGKENEIFFETNTDTKIQRYTKFFCLPGMNNGLLRNDTGSKID